MTSNALKISGLTRRFGSTVALDDFNLEVGIGELVALLGPSGCGKTTALRIIAGLEKEDAGRVYLGDVDITMRPANKRNMGMVFQSYSLFPNLTVEENVAFGLQMRKVNKSQRVNRAHELLELVGLNSQSKRFPHQLSGGQQQRVALARALAYEPEVLLLDEPLSALDAQVRANLREEIRRLQLALGTTTLFVTHDQEEAMSISDRVGVMNHGKLEQIADPNTLYNQPATAFVAGFVGVMNRIPTKSQNGYVNIFGKDYEAQFIGSVSEDVIALVRPEKISVHASTVNSNAKLLMKSFLGSSTQLTCQLSDGLVIHALSDSQECNNLELGSLITLQYNSKKALVGSV
ncbi:MAG: ABC transporter ATP-binding protein [Actinobacteria bacterium]|jgi:putative spermidine/putrescine transport system ATP-binding protein|nr:ABC transporter ATP-binding protein [Actinomycetota bacterium]NDF10280.1 ABC transporter ATP-binding protein [Actinomycetota bacterium]